MSIYDTAHELARNLRESEEYRHFLEVKAKVKADGANLKTLKDFQLKQWEIQQTLMFTEEVSEEKQQEIERLYSLLSLYPSTREYLEAEFRISSLVNDIQKIIGEAIQDALPVGFEDIEQ